ncbi:hypothetical protein R6Q59_014454 [Mikania micrantha]
MIRNAGVESSYQLHRKLRRFNYLIFVFRVAGFCFAISTSVFMISTGSGSPRWYDFGAFRFVVAVNVIVALYLLFEMIASAWEISRGSTIFAECYQVWFDFSHDQVFAYLLLCSGSAGTEMARQLTSIDTCTASNSFCIQSDIALALGFAGYLVLMISSLLSGFRAVCFIINGSRFWL